MTKLEKPCKLWDGFVNEDGYGIRKLTIAGRRVNARVHRETCMEAHGPPPAGKNDAMHLCNNRRCYEPTHLAWGNRWENMQHAVAAGSCKGERNGASKLSKTQVSRITKKKPNGDWFFTRNDLAKELGITPQTVSKIRLGQRWSHL